MICDVIISSLGDSLTKCRDSACSFFSEKRNRSCVDSCAPFPTGSALRALCSHSKARQLGNSTGTLNCLPLDLGLNSQCYYCNILDFPTFWGR